MGSASSTRNLIDPSKRALSRCPKASLAWTSSPWWAPCAMPSIAVCLRSTASSRGGAWESWCYRFPDLPRTNNDLEHHFGSVRYSERRASGRKGASPAMVVRGSVRTVAAVVTPPEGFAAADLRLADVERWRALRASLERRRESRRAQLRFRRDPDAYLLRLEELLLKQALPS